MKMRMFFNKLLNKNVEERQKQLFEVPRLNINKKKKHNGRMPLNKKQIEEIKKVVDSIPD